MLADSRNETIDGQLDFSGGMNMVSPVLADSEYRYAENIEVRNGALHTRSGTHRAFAITSWWWNEQFYFNRDNARFNDGSHTGFWFPFDFGHIPNIQGVAFFRFADDETHRQIIVEKGIIYIYDRGYFGTLPPPVDVIIGETERIQFIMANNYLVMLRGQDLEPLRWDGTDQNGFEKFTDAGATNKMPKGYTGAYVGGRLIVVNDRSNLLASDIFDIDTYDEVYQQFAVGKGDGDEIVRLQEFSGDHLLIFKKQAVYAMSGLRYAGTAGGFTGALSDYIAIENVFKGIGLAGVEALAVHGENVTWLSEAKQGIYQLRRSSEGKVLGRDVSLSEPIQPLIDRINWKYAYKACATFYNNYLLFAVPLGSSQHNDHILVYDLTARGGQGAWVSVWKSQVLEPIKFFTDDQHLYCMCEDGGVRKMFTDDPWDSTTPQYDTKLHDRVNRFYFKDDIVKWTEDLNDGGSVTRYYKCLVSHKNQPLTNTTYWEEQSDVQHLYDINSVVWTRFYRHNDIASPKRYSRCQMTFGHQNPKVTVEIEDENYLTKQTIFSAITYDRTVYDVDYRDAWVATNVNDDWGTTGRQDYSALMDKDGMYIPAFGGYYLNVYEYHDLRFIPRVANNTAFSLIITNAQGKIEIRSILNKAKYSAFARRNI